MTTTPTPPLRVLLVLALGLALCVPVALVQWVQAVEPRAVTGLAYMLAAAVALVVMLRPQDRGRPPARTASPRPSVLVIGPEHYWESGERG